MKLILNVIAVFALVMVCGCDKSGDEANQGYASEDVVCDDLYQKSVSIEDAVSFIGTPEDAHKAGIDCIERYGKLASGKELEFANRIFKVGRSRSVEDYTSLLSKKMQGVMAANDKESLLGGRISSIKEGHYHHAECAEDFYGKCDAKFAVMFGEVDKDDFKGHKNLYFPEMPTHQFMFFHFHKPNYMFIGSMAYVVEEGADYKVVVESLKNIEIPAPPKRIRVLPVAVSGVEKNTILDLFDKPHEQWHIGLTAVDNKDNTIEIVKTSQEISGEKKLEGDQAEEVLVDYDAFEKYVKVWDDVRFRFAVAIERKSEKSYGQDTGGLACFFHIASGSISSTLTYPGMEISDVSIKKDGVFVNGEMELLMFDSISEDGTVYRNRVFVRLTEKGL